MKYIIVPIKQYRSRTHKPTPQNEEFGRACKSSALIHEAIRGITSEQKDCRNLGKLTQRLSQVLQTDSLHCYGKRTAQHGDIALLEGYDFNHRRPLSSLLHQRCEGSINGVTGICSVTIPSFSPTHALKYESNPSHVRFTIAAASFDFDAHYYSCPIVKGPYSSLDSPLSLHLMAMATVRDGAPILLLLGVEFFKCINNQFLPMKAGPGACVHVLKTARGNVEA